jgi:uncharacterized membrane protein
MWLLVAIGSLFTIALIIGAPVALANGHEPLAHTIYRAFSYVCHQIPERSLSIASKNFAVCSRCTGIYTGFTFATLAYPLVRSLRRVDTPTRKWLLLAAMPLAIDVALDFFGIWHNTHASRFATGALLGAAAVFYVLPGLIDLSLRKWRIASGDAVRKLEEAQIPKALSPNVSQAPSDYSAPHRRI